MPLHKFAAEPDFEDLRVTGPMDLGERLRAPYPKTKQGKRNEKRPGATRHEPR
jgi:hypothetical protein